MNKFILTIDQGTTSTRTIIFNNKGSIESLSQREFSQLCPHNGWVEHNPEEIWEMTLETIKAAINEKDINVLDIKAIGITNQRETTVLWDKITGKPLYNAIVWQCRRTADMCEKIKADEQLTQYIKDHTGLVVDAYFSGTKIKWILDNVPQARDLANEGKLLFGTVETWLIWNLTGKHMTDITNASRTMLFDIHKKCWDKRLCDMLGIPMNILPEVAENIADLGTVREGEKIPKELVGIPICASAGDQHAALFGQTQHGVEAIQNLAVVDTNLETGQAEAAEHLVNDGGNLSLIQNVQLAVADDVDVGLVELPEAAPLGPLAPVDLGDLEPAEGEGQVVAVERHIFCQRHGQVKAQRQIAVALLEAVDLLLGLAAALGQQDLGILDDGGIQRGKAVGSVGGTQNFGHFLKTDLLGRQQFHEAGQCPGLNNLHFLFFSLKTKT